MLSMFAALNVMLFTQYCSLRLHCQGIKKSRLHDRTDLIQSLHENVFAHTSGELKTFSEHANHGSGFKLLAGKQKRKKPKFGSVTAKDDPSSAFPARALQPAAPSLKSSAAE